MFLANCPWVNRPASAKSTHYIKSFNLYKKYLKKNWDLMRNLLDSNMKINWVEKLVSDGITYTFHTDIVEKFNDFFTNIANNLDRKLAVSKTCPTSCTQFSSNFFRQTFRLIL